MRKERFLSLKSRFITGGEPQRMAQQPVYRVRQTCILHGWSMPTTCVPRLRHMSHLVLKLRLQTSGPGKGLGLAAQEPTRGWSVGMGCPEGISGGEPGPAMRWALATASAQHPQGDNGRHILKRGGRHPY